MTNIVQDAMQNLLLPQYGSIRDVFGRALEARSKQQQPGCSLFSLLALRDRFLESLNEDCAIYVREIGLVDAQRKCNGDVLGNAGRPAAEFNGSLSDFLAEMAAIRVLCGKGFNRFRAIHKAEPDGTTSDYEGYFGDTPAYIEVKNVRSTPTVVDVFNDEIHRLCEPDSSAFRFTVEVEFPYDVRPTNKQQNAICKFVASLRGRKPPFKEELDLVTAIARINVTAGYGTAFGARSIGPYSPEPISKEKFLEKVRENAAKARVQMKDENRLKVVVINYDSPSGSLSADFVYDGEQVIRAVFGGFVHPYILLYRHHVQVHE